jgi:excisionase family DNA binding protein
VHMKSQASELIGRLGPSGELKVEDAPRFVRELASEFADFVRLTGAAFAAILEARLSRPSAPPPQVTAPPPTMAVPARNDKAALTVKEVAVMFGVAESTVRLWIGRRDIAVIRLGRSVRIPKTEINRVMSENTVPVRRR